MNKQKGISLIGMLFTLVIFIMATSIVIRIVPVYIQYYSILKTIKGLNNTSPSKLTGDLLTDINTLRSSIDKRLSMNGIESLKEDQLIIEPLDAHKFRIKLKYHVI